MAGAWSRIRKGIESFFRWLGRRFAWVSAYSDIFALLFGAAAAVLAAAHSANLPSANAWASHHLLPLVQIGAVALWLITQAGRVVASRRGKRNQELEDACRAVAAFVDERCPGLPLSEVGVHIWQVSVFGRHLRRAGTFLLIGNRARSGIRWTRGKGVVGLAWEEERVVMKDLEEVRARARTADQYAELPASDRLGLTWDEFRKTPRYRAVYARPLFSRDGRSPVVKGVIAIDLLCEGHFDELARATEGSGFDGVLGVCESALRP
jgi:hypothetical protein